MVETRVQRKRREAKHGREEKEPPPSVGEEVPGLNIDNDLFSISQERARLSRAQKCRNKKQYCVADSVTDMPECSLEPMRRKLTILTITVVHGEIYC